MAQLLIDTDVLIDYLRGGGLILEISLSNLLFQFQQSLLLSFTQASEMVPNGLSWTSSLIPFRLLL